MTRSLALLLCSWLVASSAHAQATQASLATQLVPDHQALLARRERLLADQLAQLIGGMAGIDHVEVAVVLADASRRPIDEALAAPHVSLVVRVTQPRSESDVLEVVRGAASELARAHVSVTQTVSARATPAAEMLRDVGPFRVARSSDVPLRTALALLLATNVVLAALLIARFRRGRRVL